MIRSLLIGTGFWAERHVMAYQRCRKVKLAGIVGYSNERRLDELAVQYGIPKRFMDVEEALADVQPEMADISTTPRYRADGVRDCLGAGVKLVNMEKPMALAPSEAYEIERLCRDNGLRLTVNHQKKFNAPWAKARKIIAGGKLGDLRFFQATCKGNMLEQGTHLVDMLLFFRGYTPIAWVMGQVGDLDGLRKEKTPAPDSAVATMEFRDGVRAALAIGNVGWDIPGETNKWFHMGVEAYGSKGHLRISLNQTLEVTTYGSGRTKVEDSRWDDTFLQGLADHLDAAAAYAADPSVGHVSCLDHSMMSFQAVMAIYASAAGHGKVDLPQAFDDDIVDRLKAKKAKR